VRNYPDDKSFLFELCICIVAFGLFMVVIGSIPDAVEKEVDQDKMEHLTFTKQQLKEKHELYIREQSEQYAGKLQQCKTCHKN
jgi:divalent metal cation (Fe/Co/Zn/Cd) transporter